MSQLRSLDAFYGPSQANDAMGGNVCFPAVFLQISFLFSSFFSTSTPTPNLIIVSSRLSIIASAQKLEILPWRGTLCLLLNSPF